MSDYDALYADIVAAREDLARDVAALASRMDVKTNVRRRLYRMVPWRRPAVSARPSRPAVAGTVVGLLVVVACWRPARRR